MDQVLTKLLFFYALIGAGYAIKRVGLRTDRVGRVLLHVVVPLIFFSAAVTLPADGHLYAVTAVSLLSCMLVLVTSTGVLRAVRSNRDEASILGLASAWANNGLLGIPISFLVFGEDGMYVASLWAIGSISFFSLFASFLRSRFDGHKQKPLLRRLLLPAFLPSFLAGVLVGAVFRPASPIFLELLADIRLVGFALGALYVGMCMEFDRRRLDYRFTGIALILKHGLYPVIAGSLLAIDALFVGVFSPLHRAPLMLMSCMPIAVNVLILCYDRQELRARVAFAITVSTFLTGAVAVGIRAIV